MTDYNHFNIEHRCKIITTHLSLDDEERNKCVETVYSIGDQQNKASNVKADKSNWQIWKETSMFDSILDKIINVASAKCDWIVPAIGKDHVDLGVSQAWSALYKKGDYTVPHCHLYSPAAFTYYIKADDNSSPLIFSHSKLSVKPTTGMLVLFPGYLYHEVPVQQEGSDRIILAGNINARFTD